MSEFKKIVESVLKEFGYTLEEAKQVGPLYHNTSNIQEILKSNCLKAKTSSGISFDKHEGWFNDKGWHHFSYYTLILDGDKLSDNYKIYRFMNSADEFKVIPPHQEKHTFSKELKKILEKFKISKEELFKYVDSQELGGYVDDKTGELKIPFKNIDNAINKARKQFFKKHFDSSNLDHLIEFNKFNNLIKDMFIFPDEYSDDLIEPLFINNLNKYLIGLIVRYPSENDIKSYLDNKKLNSVIQEINKNIKMFKGMYPNLPVYLRDEKGHKAVLKNNQIDQLPEIKTVEYKSRRIK